MQKPTITQTLKVPVKDKHAPLLNKLARSVNHVWNYINELSHRSITERGQFLSEYDLYLYTKGAVKELGLHSQSLQCISKEYVTRRKQFKKSRLSWRNSGGFKRSLGWIPINTGAASWKHGQVNHYHRLECALGIAQRAKKKGRVQAMHATIKNKRKDDIHQFSRKLVDTNAAIFVGNVQPLPLTKTKMAKSVLDAGLRMREWACECGVTHDHDVNAARNILALGSV